MSRFLSLDGEDLVRSVLERDSMTPQQDIEPLLFARPMLAPKTST